jgi:hypothetical protein
MMEIKRFRKRPVVIEAMQYNGNNGSLLRDWSYGEVIESPIAEPTETDKDGRYVQVKTLEGVMCGLVGDWIIKGVNGEFYPCKPDIFEKTYEEVKE